MRVRHLQSYRVLGIHPGAAWTDVRAAYRSKIRAWHPDRFPDDSSRREAETATKAINQAYRELQDYYRAHGRLPLSADEPAKRAPITSPVVESEDPEVNQEPPHVRERRWHSTRASRIVLSVLLALFLAAQFLSLERGPTSSALPPVAMLPDPPPHPHNLSFSHGSTVGEVYAAQGVPTRTEGNIWYYGTSKVYFANGVVVQWSETPSHPLRARVTVSPPAPPKNRSLTFTKGSTKAFVRAVQGDPVSESDKVWDYGVSRIFFEDDHVVGWYESPMDPLKVSR